MRDYEFTLKFHLPEADADPEECLDALAEAGCDDATIGIGQRGRIALEFTRKATNAHEAIASAVRAVKAAIPGAQLIEAAPDLVGLTDVADLVGCTRQNLRKLMISHHASFPVAVHEGTQALWHLRSVLAWFADVRKRPIDRGLVEVSEAAMQINIARDARRVPGVGLPKKLAALFA